MGTMLMGITTQLFDTSRAGVAAIAAMFVVGFICFQMQRRCMEGDVTERCDGRRSGFCQRMILKRKEANRNKGKQNGEQKLPNEDLLSEKLLQPMVQLSYAAAMDLVQARLRLINAD